MSGALLVTLLPRAGRRGRAGLVALDPRTFGVLTVRTFPLNEYLPDDESSVPIQHCRGLVQRHGALFVSLFNAVGVYDVDDPGALRLTQRLLLSSRLAVDLHGLAVTDDAVLATSTGADAIVRWSRGGSEIDVVSLTGTCRTGDLRFPRRLAARAGVPDWRDALAPALHVNGVAPGLGGGLLACALDRILAVRDGAVHELVRDPGACLHDAQYSPDGALVATDAARGCVLVAASDGRPRRHLLVADPRAWFVRGLRHIGDRLLVLRSERVASGERRMDGGGGAPVAGPARFGLTLLEGSGEVVDDREIEVPELPGGSVAYAVELVRATRSQERATTATWARRLAERRRAPVAAWTEEARAA